MQEKKRKPHISDTDLDRRKFLQLAGGATLGGAALSMLPAAAEAGPKGGFHMNDHWPDKNSGRR